MRTGIASPILALSGGRPAWEHEGGTAEVVTYATAADRLGFEFMTASDHVAVPTDFHADTRFYDALATFSYLAALTKRIRFVPFVLVLPYYHPLEVAKRYGTLDHLSGGRLTLGVGVGHLENEFALLGVPFEDRGARADDALKALRASWGKSVATYHGSHYSFENLVVEPHAAQSHLPIWVGGNTRRALNRALTFGDGWSPAPVTFRGPDAGRLREMLADVDRPEGFDVLLGSTDPLDPIREPGQVTDALGEAAAAGATVFRLAVRHDSLAEYLEQLEAYAELAGLDAE